MICNTFMIYMDLGSASIDLNLLLLPKVKQNEVILHSNLKKLIHTDA
jgi:hypothetical protein